MLILLTKYFLFFKTLLISASRNTGEEFDWGLANTSVSLSATAYCGSKSIHGHIFSGFATGFVETLLINGEEFDEEGFIGYRNTDEKIYVVFRGSYSLLNWLADLSFITTVYPYCDRCRVHLGFFRYEQAIIKTVIDHVLQLKEKFPTYHVVVTGHSLGAACAALTAADLIRVGINASIYNFGSPRFGNKELSAYLSMLIPVVVRVTHYKDLVPHIPTVSQGYVHLEGEWYEDERGALHNCTGTEDPHCSDMWTYSANIADHFRYLGVWMTCDSANNNVTALMIDAVRYAGISDGLSGLRA